MKLKSKQLQQKETMKIEATSNVKWTNQFPKRKDKKIVNKIEERKKNKFNHATAVCRTCNVADTHHAEPHRLICAL